MLEYERSERSRITVVEPPRFSRRLRFLRGWSDEDTETIFPGSPGMGSAVSFRAGIGDVPPAEYEMTYYQQEESAMAA